MIPKDSCPEKIKKIAKYPGIYILKTRFVALFVEVDEEGNVHQLKPDTMARDGILSSSGWAPSTGMRVFSLQEVL